MRSGSEAGSKAVRDEISSLYELKNSISSHLKMFSCFDYFDVRWTSIIL